MHLTIPDLRGGYIALLEAILEDGRPTAPRGEPTLEILNAGVTLLDPTDALPVGIGREPNLAIGAGEALQLIGGFSDPEMMVSIAGSFERFLDGGVLAGAYGPRIRTQLPVAVERLRQDPDTRQSIALVWDARLDAFGTVPRDLPCTKDFHFFMRDGALSLQTCMRSNDAWLGVAYDFFQFCQLQLSVAKALEVPVGPYYHHADSLHIYARDIEKIEQLHAPAGAPDVNTRPIGIGHEGNSIEDMQRAALEVWSGERCATKSEKWYWGCLKGHTRPTRDEARHTHPQQLA